ncbi:hypothetical protein Hypma_014541 [Hypsizygus marmoreus]|uniref:F-box domain-containing protein n=1 Tax=Hypsizygus marmoreus TaxID=39966 RepID=A0A369JEJ0_HYPMA|nr:hypothetical protein Hypma_014541 [Hypsizygus marmoreus]
MTIQDHEHLTQLLLTCEPQRSDYILSEPTQREFRQLRLHLEALLQHLDASTGATSKHSTELSTDQQRYTHSSCTWLIQNINVSIAPHKRLPSEIWSEIFVRVTPSRIDFPPPADRRDRWLFPFQTPTAPMTAWKLMQVCARWREIAKMTPELWRSVTISPWRNVSCNDWAGSIKRLVEASREFLTRGTQLLAVRLAIDALDRCSG